MRTDYPFTDNEILHIVRDDLLRMNELLDKIEIEATVTSSNIDEVKALLGGLYKTSSELRTGAMHNNIEPFGEYFAAIKNIEGRLETLGRLETDQSKLAETSDNIQKLNSTEFVLGHIASVEKTLWVLIVVMLLILWRVW